MEDLETIEVVQEVTPVSDVELEEWYALHAHEVGGQSLDAIRFQLIGYLQEERRTIRRLAFLSELEAKTNIERRLEPFRVAVATDGRARRGPDSAPIEIVEFSDFECPYCSRGAATIDQVLEHYGDRVSLVFRHYPLPFHKQAELAAQAASCAGDQGRFFEYHDQLFAHADALKSEDLTRYAEELGLNDEVFTVCLGSGKHAPTVAADLAVGRKLGVTGTPAFFINGRPLLGAQPLDAFIRLIDEELDQR